MTNRGLKRICASCGTKFYDFGKLPIICPSCSAEFNGEIAVKSRRSKSSIVADTVNRDEIEAKNKIAAITDEAEDDDTISLEDLETDDIDDEDDDLSDLDGDIDIDLDEDDL